MDGRITVRCSFAECPQMHCNTASVLWAIGWRPAALFAYPSKPSLVRAKPLGTTGQVCSVKRAQSRALAVQLLNKTLEDRGWSTAMLARQLGVTETMAGMIRRGERHFEVGDLLLLGSVGEDIAAEIMRRLREARAATQERNRVASRLLVGAGRLVAETGDALNDGIIDDDELDRIERAGTAVLDTVRALGQTRGKP